MPVNTSPKTLPRTLGPYQLHKQLGAGGMGTVYQAEDSTLGREVAIKVLHPHLLNNAELKARFAREARLHAKINHPNIVTLYNLYEEDGQLALVMEMVHGCNLREYLRTPRNLTLEHLLKIAIEVLHGLNAAHAEGLVHRDLKPANILIAADGQVKIMDFGLAKQSQDDEDLTQSGAVVGSYRYMAPEQIMHADIDDRTDLYAFGIVLFQMVTGSLPFDSDGGSGGEFEIMEKQVRAEPPSPLELNPSLPHALHHLLLQLLAKKPEQRPDQCSTVIAALEAILRHDDTHINMPGNVKNSHHQASAVTIASGLLSAASQEANRRWQQAFPPFVRRWLPLISIALLLLWWLMANSEQSQPDSTAAKQAETHNTQLILPDHHHAAPSKQEGAQQAASKDHQQETPKQQNNNNKKSTPPKETKKPVAPLANHKPGNTNSAIILPLRHSYTLRRSDFSRSKAKNDEFTRKSHTFFKELGDYPLKNRLHTFKTGYSRLTFNQPQNIKAVIINKASVGDADFTGGYIRLMVRRDHGRWKQLFNRMNEDIEHSENVTIPNQLNPLKEVKLVFKSAEPLQLQDIKIIGKM